MVLKGLRILLAEDDARVRAFVVEELELAGGSVTQAEDGAEALCLLQSAEYDLLVTDVRMPRLDGWTLAERARSLWSDLPVLYVSAWSDLTPRPVTGAELLNKPFRPTELIQRVQAAAQACLH
jgi:DNA-binding response OmpR family regulator